MCGGNWTEHNMNTGGSWRCNLAAAPPEGSPADPSADPRAANTSSGAANSNFFTTVFGRVADAGMKWRLEHFMRRYLAHECSHRQLKVARLSHLFFTSPYPCPSPRFPPSPLPQPCTGWKCVASKLCEFLCDWLTCNRSLIMHCTGVRF